jgi:hypothetical protein
MIHHRTHFYKAIKYNIPEENRSKNSGSACAAEIMNVVYWNNLFPCLALFYQR